MKETGSIKFNCDWILEAPLSYGIIAELNKWRGELYELQLLGETVDGIGYGNISMRYKNNTFIITGSGTGKIGNLTEKHYTLVTDYDLDTNHLTTKGPVMASSESMTHAVIYNTLPEINSVMHVHHQGLWKSLLHTHPYTGEKTEYGTPQMAREIEGLLQTTDLDQLKLFAMAGHEDGVVAFGNSIKECGTLLLRAFYNIQQGNERRF
jgi:L-ribulose-5-phosphate 4-epimerase